MSVLKGMTWDHPRATRPLMAASTLFELATDIAVQWHVRSLQAFADQPLEELAADYDFIIFDHPLVGRAVSENLFVPLGSCLSSDWLNELRASSVGSTFESYVWSEQVWGLPIDAACQVSCWRSDFEGPIPEIWDDVLNVGEDLRSNGRSLAAALYPVDSLNTFLSIAATIDEASLFQDGESVVASSVGIEALEILERFARLAQPGALEMNPIEVLEMMAKEPSAPYCPASFGYVSYARVRSTNETRLSFGEFPGVRESAGRGILGGAGIGISSQTSSLENAARFCRFVADGLSQRTFYVDEGGQGANESSWNTPSLDESSEVYFASTRSAIERAYARPRYAGFVDFHTQAGLTVNEFLRSGGNAGTILETLDTQYRASRRAQ